MEERRIIKIEKQYSVLETALKKSSSFQRAGRFMGEDTTDFLIWKEKSKKDLQKLLGLDRMQSCDLTPKTLEVCILDDGILREKVLIQTEPGIYMPFYILIPERREDIKGCFLAPCGHLGGGKFSVAGCYEYPAIREIIDQYEYDYGMQLAKRGHVVLCPDLRGFGERREGEPDPDSEKDFFACSCYQLSHIAGFLRETVLGMNLWDLMRLIDYLTERDEWDLSNLGCAGFSGGGMYTLWLSALDERIKRAIISGYFYGFRDSLLIRNGNCNCNYIPGLYELFDMGDIASLIAPRPLIIQSCTEDHLNGPRGIKNVEEQVIILKKAYQLFQQEDKIQWDVHPGEHSWKEKNLDDLFKQFIQ